MSSLTDDDMKKLIASAVAFPGGARNVLFALPAPNQLSLFCDMTQSLGPSGSGKTVLIASTGGNKALGQSGASLGLNVFCKSLDAIDVSKQSLSALAAWTDGGAGLRWQVVNNKLLHMSLDFNKVEPRPAASQKSVLLFATGIKKIGTTGVSFGLNCYHPTDKPFDAARLATMLNDGPVLRDNMRLTWSDDRASYVDVSVDLSKMAVGTQTFCKIDVSEGLTASVLVRKEAAAAAAEQSDTTYAPIEGAKHVEVMGAGTDSVVLRLWLNQEIGFSSTGRTVLLASTSGHKRLENIKVNVLVYKRSDDRIRSIVEEIINQHPDPASMSYKKDLLPLVQTAMGSGVTEVSDDLNDKIKAAAKESLQDRKRPRE